MHLNPKYEKIFNIIYLNMNDKNPFTACAHNCLKKNEHALYAKFGL